MDDPQQPEKPGSDSTDSEKQRSSKNKTVIREYYDAICFLEKKKRYRLLPQKWRQKIVYRWVEAKISGKNDKEAKKVALVGISPFLASFLASLIIQLLKLWWERRHPIR